MLTLTALLVLAFAFQPLVYASGPFGHGGAFNWNHKNRIKIATGGGYTCALRADKTLKCWGLNIDGQLGQGDIVARGDGAGEMGANLPAISLGTGRTALAVAASTYHTCAVLDNGSVKCWGYIGDGRLGLIGVAETDDKGDGPNEMGDNLPAVDLGSGRTAVDIVVGNQHTCALLDNATVKCWGKSPDGQLGQGNINSIGDNVNEMGDNLAAIPMGTGRSVTQLASGTWHNCALLDNATVKCWGYGGSGRLGQGNANNLGDGANEMGDNLNAINLGAGKTVKYIAAGGAHTCAILNDDKVKCWGEGFYGTLGQGGGADLGDGATEMGDNLAYVDLGTGRTAKKIVASTDSNCAILDNDTVKCWGRGSEGRLGYGTANDRGDGVNEMGDNLPTVSLGTAFVPYALSIGAPDLAFHVCVISTTNAIKCWGGNATGQLGLGDVSHRGDAANEMGDFLSLVGL